MRCVAEAENRITRDVWAKLSVEAWKARDNAFIFGKTKVGAALMSTDGRIFVGCNVEHIFRSHDIHAEVNAISSMVAAGSQKVIAILVAAERERFTPCGACMDWIFQHGGVACVVAFQAKPDAELHIYEAHELMPHYPI